MTTPNGRQQEPTSSKTAARTPRGPLAGLRVLDLTWVLSGPYAAMTLCDLGAEVIKVERPPYGDIARTTGPFLGEEPAYFISINRGKGSVSLDLRSPEGRKFAQASSSRIQPATIAGRRSTTSYPKSTSST